MRFSKSPPLLVPLETAISIIMTGWLILQELTDLVNSAIVFVSQTWLFLWLIFPLGSVTLLDLFLSFDPRICSTVAFTSSGNSDYVVFLVSIDFPSKWIKGTPFHHADFHYYYADWDGLHDNSRDILLEYIFKISTFAAAAKFCEWVKTGIARFAALMENLENQGKGRRIQKIGENLENSGNFVWKSDASGKTQGILFWNKIHFYVVRIFCMPTCYYRFTSFQLTKDMK